MMSITIQQLVNALDPEKVGVQMLGNTTHERTMRGGQKRAVNPTHLEIKLHTVPENMHKEALIIWVDRKDLSAAMSALKDEG